jgi:hypothetical protein
MVSGLAVYLFSALLPPNAAVIASLPLLPGTSLRFLSVSFAFHAHLALTVAEVLATFLLPRVTVSVTLPMQPCLAVTPVGRAILPVTPWRYGNFLAVEGLTFASRLVGAGLALAGAPLPSPLAVRAAQESS